MSTRMNIRIDEEWKTILENLAEREGLDRSTTVRTAVLRWWENTGREPETEEGSNSDIVNTMSAQVNTLSTQLTEKDSQIAKLQSMIESLQEDATQKNALHLNLQNQLERQQLMLESTQTKLERERLPWYRRMFGRGPQQVTAEVEE